jgi:hypothetical protein
MAALGIRFGSLGFSLSIELVFPLSFLAALDFVHYFTRLICLDLPAEATGMRWEEVA